MSSVFSKQTALTSAHLLVGNSSGVATDTAVTGDVSITNAGVTAVVAASSTVAGKIKDIKQYVVGTTYNSILITFTSAGNSCVNVRTVMVPYQTSDGTWRMRINSTYTSANATTNSWTLNGITSKNVSFYNQGLGGACTTGPAVASFYILPNTATFNAVCTAAQTNWTFSGDIELDSKPTWAD